jgi:large subunit ribosomal protein L21
LLKLGRVLPFLLAQSTEQLGDIDMYAVVKSGGKQHKLEVGETVSVELLDAEPGSVVTLPALLVSDGENITVGKDAAAAIVTAEVLGHGKADKVIIFKFKKRKGSKKLRGHRQKLTLIRVTEIALGDKVTKAAAAPAAKKVAAAKAPAAKKAPAKKAAAAAKPAAKAAAAEAKAETVVEKAPAAKKAPAKKAPAAEKPAAKAKAAAEKVPAAKKAPAKKAPAAEKPATEKKPAAKKPAAKKTDKPAKSAE